MIRRLSRFAAGIALAALLVAPALASKPALNGPLINETGLAYDSTYTLDMSGSGIDRLSALAYYSSSTFQTASFNDGRASTGTITVVSTGTLSIAASTNTITISTTSGLSGMLITFITSGQSVTVLREGSEWTKVNTTTGNADALTTAINTYVPGVVASSASAVITVTASETGPAGNAYSVTDSTTAISIASAHFANGRPNAEIFLAGQRLVQGTDWTVGATKALTAKAISDALMANTAIAAVIRSTWGANGVVSATSTASGSATAYSIGTNVPSALTLSSPQMQGGGDTAIDLANSRLQLPAHGLTNGLAVLYSTGSAVTIGGLTKGTTYYVGKIDANYVKLATSKANALAGTFVTFTSSPIAAANTFSLSPLAITGTPSFKVQVSNDGTVFTDLAVSSVTLGSYTAPYTTTGWDFGQINYRYIRYNVTGPTTGGILLNVTLYGKND